MTLAEFRHVFQGPPIGNCGYAPATAEEAVAGGQTDLIAFGRPLISNPGLVARLRNGWPLAESAEMYDRYSPIGKRGYTDFLTYSAAE